MPSANHGRNATTVVDEEKSFPASTTECAPIPEHRCEAQSIQPCSIIVAVADGRGISVCYALNTYTFGPGAHWEKWHQSMPQIPEEAENQTTKGKPLDHGDGGWKSLF